jgi:putative PIN family toxin of toxin-antitoxin system
MRVILDANIFIAYLLTTKESGIFQLIVAALFEGKFTLLLFDAVIEEMAKVLIRKDYLKKIITVQDIDDLVTSLEVMSEVMPPITEAIPAVVRDPKDDYLLAYAVIYKADYLVTSDPDLTSLKQVENVKIINPVEFVRLLEK